MAALEGVRAIKTGELHHLSTQQLVDCAGAFNNHGCDGGLPSQAFEYIRYVLRVLMIIEFMFSLIMLFKLNPML